jgi:UDP-N-acetylglucosamine--N-acetylmuramyl-(pentapeptide) pyrophosphoryl-undecaprenol N-acetylglucosamine transferase
MEADLVQRAGIPFTAVPAAGVHGVGWRALPRNIIQLGQGFLSSRRILQQFKPDLLLFTGGFVAAPMALAGNRIPSLLYVPDIEPGLALNFIARFARRIAVTAEDSLKYFPDKGRSGKVVVTGYPTRSDLGSWTTESARARLGIQAGLPVLLFFGGSKGARSINQALLAVLPPLLEIAQVIHITGQLDWPEMQAAQTRLNPLQMSRYHAYPYLHDEMGAALASANLAVSRAGASSLGELPLFGLPAILVPYPHAWRYQKVNADYLVRQGAAVMLEDARLKDDLLPTIIKLMGDPQSLQAMQQKMLSLARPQAASQIAGLLRQLAPQTSPVGGNVW